MTHTLCAQYIAVSACSIAGAYALLLQLAFALLRQAQLPSEKCIFDPVLLELDTLRSPFFFFFLQLDQCVL